jgi:hypothetical protein
MKVTMGGIRAVEKKQVDINYTMDNDTSSKFSAITTGMKISFLRGVESSLKNSKCPSIMTTLPIPT